jgi:uncharacterized membrane protein
MPNPIKATFKTECLPVLLLFAAASASVYFYRHFPSRVPAHWNFAGQVDGWSSPAAAAFFLPILILAIYLLFLFIPRIDPQRERYAEFTYVYHLFKNVFVAFMTVLYFMTGLNGIGYTLPIGSIVPVMIGILFVMIGNYMGKLKLNWFIGARTPWTLSSETVWNKTNRLAGKLFVIGGLLMASEAFIPLVWRLPVLFCVIIAVALIPMIYSYVLYSKEKRS